MGSPSERIHAITLIRKFAEAKGVPAEQMLAYMLELLRNTHVAIGAGREPNVLVEIQSIMGALNQTEWPQSILTAVELRIEMEHSLHRLNLREAEKTVNQAGIDHNAKLAKIAEAIRLLLREIINEAEHAKIATTLWIEDIAKDAGSDKPPGDE